MRGGGAGRLAGLLVLAGVATGPSAFAATAEALLEAMEVQGAAGVSSEGDAGKMLGVYEALGGIVPTQGPTMAWMFTGDQTTLPSCVDTDVGLFGPEEDTAALELELLVPDGVRSFSFDFFFLSREYPVFVGSPFNDSFTVELESEAYTGNVAFDDAGNPVDVNNVLFVGFDPETMGGTGFHCGDGGGSLWIRTLAPVVPGEVIRLRFQVEDVTDGIYDSGVAIDNFTWSTAEIDGPETGPADIDKDGEEDEKFGGTDCDDRDPLVNSRATEDCADGVDNDCDGAADGDDVACMTTDDLGGWTDGPGACACASSPSSPSLAPAGLLALAALARRRRGPAGAQILPPAIT
ncbi:putative metal-binding motif-containing protein [Myxococcota bacterium]|nr:putative metal-binding motif-containing protein [Myxococcota bacterium]